MTTLAHNQALPDRAMATRAAPRPKQQASSGAADLLARLRRRDRDALIELVESYGGALTRVAYLQLGDAHAADDAVQDAMIGAWDGARRTNGDTKLWPWLLGIVFNRCRKHLRTVARRRRREHAAAQLKQQASDNAGDADRRDQLDALREALTELDPTLRSVIILRYEQGLGVAEAAAVLGIPEGTVKRRSHTARKQLKDRLRDQS